jgi:N-acetylglucosaminyldiphosphoundecaprenol N-acetyl-beta-D-mannosaminyltransferase
VSTLLQRREKARFLAVDLSTLDRTALLAALEQALAEDQRLTISFLNPDYARRAARDLDLAGLINAFDVLLADGWGVVWGARLLGINVPDRLANDDIARDVFALCARRGTRIFLFGSAPGIAERAAANLTDAFPGLRLVGCQHGWRDRARGHPGYYDEADSIAIVDEINASGAELLVVGIPTPMQQRWVIANAERLAPAVIITGGSWIDHLSERIDWYPTWVLKSHLCWLYRLQRDPRRLWRRYTLELIDFARLVAEAKLRRRRTSLDERNN